MWYAARGFRIAARNWRCPAGELDLVLCRGSLVVICEVKARRGLEFGGGYEAVGWRKQRKVRQLAELFLQTWEEPFVAVRFDVASVVLMADAPDIEVFEDSF